MGCAAGLLPRASGAAAGGAVGRSGNRASVACGIDTGTRVTTEINWRQLKAHGVAPEQSRPVRSHEDDVRAARDAPAPPPPCRVAMTPAARSEQ